jgi:hypothetical protein
LADPCNSNVEGVSGEVANQISSITINDMTTTVKRATKEIHASIWKDNASSNYGPNDDGLSFCGPRTYSMTAPATIPSWFTNTGSDAGKNREIDSTVLTNSEIDNTPGTDYTIRVCL